MMLNYIHYFNMLLVIPAVVIQILCVLILALLFFTKGNKILSFVKDKFLALGLLFSAVATLSSLFYSEIIGFIPCSLCWWQRIFMYPLVFIFGIAYFKNDKGIIKYALPITLVGMFISVKHNFIYYFTNSTMPCDASGVSCVKKLVSEFGGYISIPMLALTSFVGILVVLLVAHYYKKED